jgi:hypothetical protein
MNTITDPNLSGYQSNLDNISNKDREELAAIRESWKDISQFEPGQQEHGDPSWGKELETPEKPKLESPSELPNEVRQNALSEGKTLESHDVTHTAEIDKVEAFPPPTESVEEYGQKLQEAGVEHDEVGGGQ